MSSATVLPAPAQPRKKVTIPSLMKKMKEGEAIVQMAVYDYRSAVVADRLGIDILCVSDTGGMVLFGHRSTVSVSFEEVMFMAQAVDRGSRYGLRMVDMPYMSFHLSAQQAVDNAAKYTPPEGSIEIRWWSDGEGGHLAVIDTGFGIPSEHIPRLTERFYRVDAGRSRAKGGSGLGLAIVKHVLQRHGARLEVQSTLGEGSSFICHFPPERLAQPVAPALSTETA